MKNHLSVFAMHLVLLFVLIGTIVLVFELHRYAFLGMLAVLLALLMVAAISIVGLANNASWSFRLLLGFFVLVFINQILLLALSVNNWIIYQVILVVAIVGFIICLLNAGRKHHKAKPQIIVEHDPGKYIASKMASTFHIPKCDWVNNIKPANRVWFASKEDAKKAGKKPHECVK